MKRWTLISMIGLATAATLAGDGAQTNSTPPPKPQAVLTNNFNIATNFSLQLNPFQKPGGGRPFAGTNGFQSLLPEPMIHDSKPSLFAPLKPGLFKTAPYSMIVIVPGDSGDEQFAASVGDANSRMPIVRPELKFIPLERAKK
jgi:hypothetical protein